MKNKVIPIIFSCLVIVGLGVAESFSAADQEAAFDALAVKIKEDSLSGKEVKKLGFIDKDDKTDIDYDGFVYTLEFRNRSSASLNDLEVECRFFYTLDSLWRSVVFNYSGDGKNAREKSEQKYYEDSLSLSLQPNERYKAETRSFVIESWSLTSGYYFSSGTADRVDADPDGLWVRVSYKTSSGEMVTRDFCEPESLFDRVSWNGKSI